jgi:hypothetical protein
MYVFDDNDLLVVWTNNYSCHIPPLSMPAGSGALWRTIREPEQKLRTAEIWYASANSAGIRRSVAALALLL